MLLIGTETMIAGGGGVLFNVKGFRFQPTDKELVVHHLIPKILDPDSDHHYIDVVNDLTQLEPSDLFRIMQKNPDDREGYFFWSPTYKNGKICRKGKNGFWSETRGSVSIDSAAVDAKKRVFVFREGVYPGTRTAWSIHQFELTHHQGKKNIFLCKLVEHKQKDRDSNKRKAEHNVQETSAKPKRATKDNTSRKKAKVSSAKEPQVDDEHNNNILSSEVLHGSQSLPSDPDSSILTGDQLTLQSHHLLSKVFSENISNNILAGDHPWSPGGFHPSNSFLVNIQDFSDNQRHHLPSNSINNISTCVGMQPNHHFPSSTSEEISNGDPQYNEQRQEGSQLSCHLPLDPENGRTCSELVQMSHHLPSNCKESIVAFDVYQENQSKLPQPESCSWDTVSMFKNSEVDNTVLVSGCGEDEHAAKTDPYPSPATSIPDPYPSPATSIPEVHQQEKPKSFDEFSEVDFDSALEELLKDMPPCNGLSRDGDWRLEDEDWMHGLSFNDLNQSSDHDAAR